MKIIMNFFSWVFEETIKVKDNLININIEISTKHLQAFTECIIWNVQEISSYTDQHFIMLL